MLARALPGFSSSSSDFFELLDEDDFLSSSSSFCGSYSSFSSDYSYLSSSFDSAFSSDSWCFSSSSDSFFSSDSWCFSSSSDSFFSSDSCTDVCSWVYSSCYYSSLSYSSSSECLSDPSLEFWDFYSCSAGSSSFNIYSIVSTSEVLSVFRSACVTSVSSFVNSVFVICLAYSSFLLRWTSF